MADLERLIEAWRRSLAAFGVGPDELAELESHLRDDVDRLRREGISDERALEQATARLGPPQALAAEFARTAAPARWLPLPVTAGALGVLALLLAGVLLDRLLTGRVSVLLAAHLLTVTVGYSTTLAVGVLAAAYVLRRTQGDLSPGQTHGLARGLAVLNGAAGALTAIGFVLGGVWAQEHLGRFWTWDPREIGAVCVLAWDVLLCVLILRRLCADSLAVLLGLAGSALTYLAWFGAVSLSAGTYGRGSVAAAHTVVLLVHVVFFCAGLVQARRLARGATA